MTSDKELVKRRSPEELRYLKEHVEKIRSDPRVAAATDAYENAQPRFTLEALRSGVMIDTFPCRMTIGTLALLRGTSSRCLGYGKDEGPLTEGDIAQAVFLLADDVRNEAISVADDVDELAEAVKRFSRKLDLNRAALDLYEFLRRIGAALSEEEQGDGDEEEQGEESERVSIWHAPDDAWADDVDLLASEYGWRSDWILWEEPIVRTVRLKESLQARRSSKPRTAGRGRTGIELLKKIEKIGGELRQDEQRE